MTKKIWTKKKEAANFSSGLKKRVDIRRSVLKKVVVHTVNGKTLDFVIADEEVPQFKERINEGVRGLSSSSESDFFWINMQNVVYIALADVANEEKITLLPQE